MSPRSLGKALLLAFVLSGTEAAALENVFILSDTVAHFERVFGVRGRVVAWFGAAGGSTTVNFSFPAKGNVSFRLAEPAGEDRYIDQVQVEPNGAVLTVDQAKTYARYLTDDLARHGSACALTRDDQDGINAFILYSCTEKSRPAAPPMDVLITVQSINGRNALFVQISPKKR